MHQVTVTAAAVVVGALVAVVVAGDIYLIPISTPKLGQIRAQKQRKREMRRRSQRKTSRIMPPARTRSLESASRSLHRPSPTTWADKATDPTNGERISPSLPFDLRSPRRWRGGSAKGMWRRRSSVGEVTEAPIELEKMRRTRGLS